MFSRLFGWQYRKLLRFGWNFSIHANRNFHAKWLQFSAGRGRYVDEDGENVYDCSPRLHECNNPLSNCSASGCASVYRLMDSDIAGAHTHTTRYTSCIWINGSFYSIYGCSNRDRMCARNRRFSTPAHGQHFTNFFVAVMRSMKIHWQTFVRVDCGWWNPIIFPWMPRNSLEMSRFTWNYIRLAAKLMMALCRWGHDTQKSCQCHRYTQCKQHPHTTPPRASASNVGNSISLSGE